ncbi:MAG: phosphatidylglycerol lysyltransferase domain-containing protein [Synergistota bacterium]|nr:phosphatidylglycerol lysyltransferase domain-containing protein [Synergistota bacterium]
MPFDFTPVSRDRAAEYGRLYSLSPRKSSWYSPGSLWGWRNIHGLEWAFEDGLCWIRARDGAFWAPAGEWREIDWEELLHRRFPMGVTFHYVPDGLCEILRGLPGGRIVLREDRSQWEYVYSVRELVELKGNRFSRKRSHFNQFVRSYRYNYKALSGEEVASVLEGQDVWMREQEHTPYLEQDDRAIRDLLGLNPPAERLLAGAIEVDGNMIAYTVAEVIDDDTIVVHFEKALRRFKGAYQAINRLFLKNTAHSFKFVNREEDMDDEGMRVAKMSYHPVDFIKKCVLVWSPA